MVYRLILLLMLFGFGYGQSWQVEGMDKITTSSDGLYFYPQFSPDGNKIYFTTSKYTGLFSYDLSRQSQENLIDEDGAGYQPVFSGNGKKIYFRKSSFINRRRESVLVELDVETETKRQIDTGEGQVLNPKMVNDRFLVFQTHPELQVLDLKSYQVTKPVTLKNTIVYADDMALSLFRGNTAKKLSPMGEGHYIWSSVSPDQNYILFTLAGKGTYVSDLEGNILHELGYAHAPKWSPDGNWILYMVDRDDGHQYTSSEIFVTSLNGHTRFQLTETNLIALYPNWSPDGKRIIFHSNEGEIYLVHLSYTSERE